VIGLVISLLVMVVFWRVLVWIDRLRDGPSVAEQHQAALVAEFWRTAQAPPQFSVVAGERLRAGQAVYLGSDGKVRGSWPDVPVGRVVDGSMAWEAGTPLLAVDTTTGRQTP
jgi:hypothetical protein